MFKVKDFANIRDERQRDNYRLAEIANLKGEHKNINPKAMDRLVAWTGHSRARLIEEANANELVSKLLSYCTAINASRQGTKDEAYVINGIANVLKKHNIAISNLATDELVPIKNGDILPRAQAKKYFSKNELLKSFDFAGKIAEHNVDILGFAKVCIGQGGHQDNVYMETTALLEWVQKHGVATTLYVVLVDGLTDGALNKYKNLKSNYNLKKVFIGNHIEFQDYMIQEYGKQ